MPSLHRRGIEMSWLSRLTRLLQLKERLETPFALDRR